MIFKRKRWRINDYFSLSKECIIVPIVDNYAYQWKLIIKSNCHIIIENFPMEIEVTLMTFPLKVNRNLKERDKVDASLDRFFGAPLAIMRVYNMHPLDIIKVCRIINKDLRKNHDTYFYHIRDFKHRFLTYFNIGYKGILRESMIDFFRDDEDEEE